MYIRGNYIQHIYLIDKKKENNRMQQIQSKFKAFGFDVIVSVRIIRVCLIYNLIVPHLHFVLVKQLQFVFVCVFPFLKCSPISLLQTLKYASGFFYHVFFSLVT